MLFKLNFDRSIYVSVDAAVINGYFFLDKWFNRDNAFTSAGNSALWGKTFEEVYVGQRYSTDIYQRS